MKAYGLISLTLMVVVGCAGTTRTTRVADVAARDFYTSDEIKGLSPEARDRYCASLEEEIRALRAEADRFNAAADSVSTHADSLRQVNVELSTQIRDLDGEIRQLRLDRRAMTEYSVKAGDTLQKIASVVYGNSSKWREIYLANKDIISDANAPLRPGMRLKIPSK